MPFEQSRVNPVVADLLKVRAYIAEHGFSPNWHEAGCRCFMGSAHEIEDLARDDNAAVALYAIEAELIARFGKAHDSFGLASDGVFAKYFLSAHGVTTKAIALEIIDAAIARAYA